MKTSIAVAAVLPGLFVLSPLASAETTTEPPSSSPATTTTTTTTEPSPQPLPVWLKLSAYSGQPGWKVSVAAACEGTASPLTSAALRVTEPLGRNAEGHQPWALFGETVIRDVPSGSYPVSFDCAGTPVTVHFTVLAKEKASQTAKIPSGAPQTGDGSW
ncbi:hypothetical protein [Amycolatopsis sp.]|uniref:hypothetical protein n=1 Tax=Amycolatopsis sp. TaxID=37632 RepID=UPI002C204CE6|nr:hypothetical protein [Amycolatopsis sp.]HVV13144.1 hypothetical protein [Amycolatopsis sp.]